MSRLYVEAHMGYAAADALRKYFDIVFAPEVGMQEQDNPKQLCYAAQEGRIFLTSDYHITTHAIRHAGIIIVHQNLIRAQQFQHLIKELSKYFSMYPSQDFQEQQLVLWIA